MDYIIDYLTITIKPDKHAENPYPLDFNEFLDFTQLFDIFSNFIDLGSRMFYEHCYSYNCINIYTPRQKDFENMGFCLSMSGQGCRFFENHIKGFTWKYFFQALRCYVELGCSVNIARIDFAFDDIVKENSKKPLLDLDTIESYRNSHLFTSLYRKSDKQIHDNFEMKSSIHETIANSKVSKTIYFGSRKSNSFCRFYDKLVEQEQKFKSSLVELEELKSEKISHWVRFEVVFKNSVAIKIINSMLELSDELFNKSLAEVICYYLRFIEPDNDNRYKCSIASWWSAFLGTFEKAKLKTIGIAKNAFKRSVEWFARSVAPTLAAILKSVGTESVLDMIETFGDIQRWKQKHFEISRCSDISEQAISNDMYWRSLVPLFCTEMRC